MYSDGDVVKVDGIDGTKGTNHQLNSLEETREGRSSSPFGSLIIIKHTLVLSCTFCTLC